ncbi:hypothetical protein A2837_02955 [Candidatus Kaiserbacteria bacterium RIFCSPHIGHO2_01_FULL_46_22]|uniref:Uncharacterized protein n=1 Tax=Candidatus Kaiserbacteria bacterium RIFCSPHIGHO2_01_FULL_46_22 TaxID=1798475 RepID=A0A1F6BWX3_9BACT|nr:MAG: hypothetical protein A2837_02955 [Candidatus Kaiserbacteria bacterium RIFCSPHIGHO2_01_FULL_46_22]
MTGVVSKIKRLRTFSGDVMDARGDLSVPEEPMPKVVPAVKAPPLITVMPPVTKVTPPPPPPPPKPLPPVALVKKSEPVVTIATPPVQSVPVSHNLNEELSALNKVTPSSILAASPNRIDVMEAESSASAGSIISDHKNDRFNLFSATWQALKEWFATEREEFEKKQSEKAAAVPKVRPVESRKEVVLKAASQSALAPKDDYRKVVSQHTSLPVEKRSAPEAVVTIKSRAAVPAPSWSHFEGEPPAAATPSVPPPSPTPKPVEQKPFTPPVAVVIPPPVIEKPVEVAAETVITPIEPKPVAPTLPPAEVPLSAAVETVEKPVSVPSYSPEVIEEPAVVQTQNTAREEIAPSPQVATQKPIRFASAKPSPFPIIRIGTIAVMSIILGVSASLWLFGGGSEDNQEIAGQEETISLISADQKVDVPVTNDRDEFLEQMTEISVPVENAVTLLRPRIDLSGTASTPPTATVLQILNLRLPGSFTRSIETINFGRYNGRSFIVLRVTSFDAGFSGLLEGETSLINDLQPLFGSPVEGTFDPSLRTVGGAGEPFFVDSAVKNHDVRILRDELQKERLVYGFVNRNTVLIATDSAVFAAAADKIK